MINVSAFGGDPEPMFDRLKERGFEIECTRTRRPFSASTSPKSPSSWRVFCSIRRFRFEEIIGSGGGETKGTQRLRRALASHEWRKHIFSRTADHRRHPTGSAITRSTTSKRLTLGPSRSRSNGTTRTPSSIAISKISRGSMLTARFRSASSSPVGVQCTAP